MVAASTDKDKKDVITQEEFNELLQNVSLKVAEQLSLTRGIILSGICGHLPEGTEDAVLYGIAQACLCFAAGTLTPAKAPDTDSLDKLGLSGLLDVLFEASEVYKHSKGQAKDLAGFLWNKTLEHRPNEHAEPWETTLS